MLKQFQFFGMCLAVRLESKTEKAVLLFYVLPQTHGIYMRAGVWFRAVEVMAVLTK